MEQYVMPKGLDWVNLRKCINQYSSDSIYIRLVGCKGGTVKVDESLEGRTLNFRREKPNTIFSIDNQDVFTFTNKGFTDEKGFSLAYERFYPPDEKCNQERMVILSHGENPNDHMLPEPRRSFLSTV